jgi:uncharacterized protein YoxC
MKFTVASVALLAVTASAANIKRQNGGEEADKVVTIPVPDVASKFSSLTSKVGSVASDIASNVADVPGDASSKVSEVVTDVASKVSEVASDIDSVGDKITSGAASKASQITSFIGSAVANGITLSIPALPTDSINTDALANYVSQIQTKFEPDVISSIKAGQTPDVVTKFIESLPTEYRTVAAVAFSDAAKQTNAPSNNGGNTAGSGDGGSAASVGRSYTGLMAAVCVGVAGLAIYL